MDSGDEWVRDFHMFMDEEFAVVNVFINVSKTLLTIRWTILTWRNPTNKSSKHCCDYLPPSELWAKYILPQKTEIYFAQRK